MARGIKTTDGQLPRLPSRRRRAFDVGAYVHSVAVGSRGEFDGTIVADAAGGYDVRDADGNTWLRSRGELSPATKERTDGRDDE